MEIQRRMLLALKGGLNNKIDALKTARWDAEDAAFWSSFGGSNPNFTVEHVQAENFYVGHRPSLIEAPVSAYPNCAVMAYQAMPRPNDDDDLNWYQETVAIEMMAKSPSSEEEVNYRIQRMSEAAHEVVLENKTLSGYITKMDDAQRFLIGDLFVRRQEKGRGIEFLWQGSRIEYTVSKLVSAR